MVRDRVRVTVRGSQGQKITPSTHPTSVVSLVILGWIGILLILDAQVAVDILDILALLLSLGNRLVLAILTRRI